MAEPHSYVVPRLSGHASGAVRVGSGVAFVAVGVSPESGQSDLGAVVIRIELSLDGTDGEPEWFDAGTAIDLDDTNRARIITAAGYSGIRLAVRTAADDAGGIVRVFIGEPTGRPAITL